MILKLFIIVCIYVFHTKANELIQEEIQFYKTDHFNRTHQININTSMVHSGLNLSLDLEKENRRDEINHKNITEKLLIDQIVTEQYIDKNEEIENKNISKIIAKPLNNETISKKHINANEEREDKNIHKNILETILNDETITKNHFNEKDCKISPEISIEINKYKSYVEKIIKYVLSGDFKGKAFDLLAEMTDTFGARMTGTKELESSIEWIKKKSKEEKLENVHSEYFKAPHWVRNNESLYLVRPRGLKMSLLGLGSSVGTPNNGIWAETFVVRTFQQLEDNPQKARGKIVVYNPTWTSYSDMVIYRVRGASKAAKVGAVASLVSSVTPFSIYSPHTGWQVYDKKTHKIPTASITKEDAEMLQRFQDRGETTILHLYMGAQNFPEVIVRNLVSEVVGSDLPDEVVVVSGHIDSWDVGVGAMDDGGGSIISWLAPVILRKLGLKPRRTIRTVLFSGEEQGLHGGQAYFNRHSKSKEKFQILLESDTGTFNPFGLSFSGNSEALCLMKKVLSLFDTLNTTRLVMPMEGGPDITMWEKAGLPTGALLNSNEDYFFYHHSEGDTMTVQDREALDKCTAFWTALAFILGDFNVTLPR